ncbi:MAG: NAD(+) diphosphatase [Desulfobacterales bacterium]
MTFDPAVHPAADSRAPRWWFLFCRDRSLVRYCQDQSVLPYFTDVSFVDPAQLHPQYLGRLDGTDCFAAELASDTPLPAGVEMRPVRRLLGVIDDELAAVAGRANQMIHWAQTHRFCGRCGHPTRDARSERAKKCPACGLVNYPRVSPAIIVAVIDAGRILLARSTRVGASFYSVLAGFVEPGETLEECVRREVGEEVGLGVTAIRYFGSQPWPFPNTLMVAFTARYAEGELRLNPVEIAAADWFSAGALPPVPGRWSIARRLIDWFEESQGVVTGEK